MKFNDSQLDISILNYLGTLENGVVVMLSILYENNSYEATYWYNSELEVLTFSKDLITTVGNPIKLEDYPQIIEFLKSNTTEYDEIYPTLNPV